MVGNLDNSLASGCAQPNELRRDGSCFRLYESQFLAVGHKALWLHPSARRKWNRRDVYEVGLRHIQYQGETLPLFPGISAFYLVLGKFLT